MLLYVICFQFLADIPILSQFPHAFCCPYHKKSESLGNKEKQDCRDERNTHIQRIEYTGILSLISYIAQGIQPNQQHSRTYGTASLQHHRDKGGKKPIHTDTVLILGIVSVIAVTAIPQAKAAVPSAVETA